MLFRKEEYRAVLGLMKALASLRLLLSAPGELLVAISAIEDDNMAVIVMCSSRETHFLETSHFFECDWRFSASGNDERLDLHGGLGSFPYRCSHIKIIKPTQESTGTPTAETIIGDENKDELVIAIA
jgi:hypothetical protein